MSLVKFLKLVFYFISLIGKIPSLPFVIFKKLISTFNFDLKAFLKAFYLFPKKRVLGGSFFTLFIVGGFVFWFFILKDLPSVKNLTDLETAVSTKILDRNGDLLYKIYKDQNRTPVAFSEIPPYVKNLTLAAEDWDFYSHSGFSLRGIIRSVFKNATEGQLTGGSTITQQLVKNTLLTPEKTITRKIKELILSIEIERQYSKDQILEMYLNQVPYGGSAYGIEEASWAYFGKEAKKLNLAEAALLAGLPKSPTKFSPFGTNPELALDRQKEVLKQALEHKLISQEDFDKASNQKLVFAENRTAIAAPHFVMFVRQMLAEKYGEEVLEKGGLTVKTTLDLNIQKMAEEVVKKQLVAAKRFNIGNASVVVLDPKTGEILAMVGSKDYFDTKNDGNVNVALRLRSPGSSAKVIAYAYALSHGSSPASIIQDTAVRFSVAGQEPYIPKNYDSQFRGPISLRSSLAESRNIPAVRTLASFGSDAVQKFIDLGTKMGITTFEDPKNYGLSITLGGMGSRLLDLSYVYATIANSGKKPEMTFVTEITDYKEKVLEKSGQSEQAVVLDPRVAFMLTDILKDNGARAPSFGINSALVVPGHPEVAVKTGTSNDIRDNVTVGFNQNYLVAVWVGNNDNSPIGRIASGITGAAPIWNEIMRKLLVKEPVVPWTTPENLVQLSCNGKRDWFLKESVKCPVYVDVKNKKIPQGRILPDAASTDFRDSLGI